jgi:hypothetical protein
LRTISFKTSTSWTGSIARHGRKPGFSHFGKILGANDPRILQFALKYSF